MARWDTEFRGLGLGDTDGVVEVLDTLEFSSTPLDQPDKGGHGWTEGIDILLVFLITNFVTDI